MDRFLQNSVYGRQWKERIRAGIFNSSQLLINTLLIAIRYLHAVTKARNRTLASETGGGILADEMGMGKSLSTLALITKTLDKAYDWVMEKEVNPENHNRQKACRATLVLVPSASRSTCGFQVLYDKLLTYYLVLINEWFHEIDL
jgi:SWI/SNF-related matrix-associated actin-dependent regulator of chromatin subfamily A3